MTSLPCTLTGRKGSGGAFRRTTHTLSSSGADLTNSRYCWRTCFAWSMGKTINPAMISGPTGWSLNSNCVTTPKLPPPPLIAQNKSVFSFSLARILSPSAVTISAATRLSIVMPYFRVNHPKPPPNVRPAIPVVELIPTGVASPWA